MASYAQIYYNQFYDIYNQLLSSRLYEDGFAGSDEEVDTSDTPVIIKMNGIDPELFTAIKVTNAIVVFDSETDDKYESLFTANALKYQLRIQGKTEMLWRGLLIPDFHQEPYISAPYWVTLTAQCGLGYLKNFKWADEYGALYTGKKTLMECIVLCLDKLNNTQDIYCNIDLYEENYNRSLSVEPLTLTYLNAEIFVDSKGDPLSCYEVLRNILSVFGSNIRYASGAWHIVRISKQYTSYTRRRFDSTGSYISYASYNPVVLLNANSNSYADFNGWVNENQVKEILPAWKRFKINQDYGLQENILPGGTFLIDDFNHVSGSEYTNLYWTYTPGSSSSGYYNGGTMGKLDIDETRAALVIYGATENITKAGYASTLLNLTTSTDKLRITINYRRKFVPQVLPDVQNYGDVYFMVKLGSYYLDAEGAWSTTLTYIHFEDVTGSSNYTKFEVISDDIPSSANLEIRIYQDDSYVAYPSPRVAREINVESVKVEILTDDILPSPDLSIDYTVDENNNHIPSDMNFLIGDLPDLVNADLIYKNGLFWLYSTTYIPTKNWAIQADTNYQSLLSYLIQDLAAQHSSPRHKIKGTLISNNFSLLSTIQDPWNGNRKFVMNMVDWNLYDGEWQGEFIEIAMGTGSYVIDHDDDAVWDEADGVILDGQ